MAISIVSAAAQADDGDKFFREQVRPVLERHCLNCHNDEAMKGDFSLQTAEAAMAEDHIVPGDPQASRLVEVLIPVDGDAEMPKNAAALSSAEIKTITDWVRTGAKWPSDLELRTPVADLDWWSLQPLTQPQVPRVPSEAEIQPVRTPIDAFIVAKLRDRGLQPSPAADRATLIRRLYFDLLGLPPTPEEIARFVADPNPAAYEQLVDRLLQSPHYGERWARHWLDVVHYADTHGYDKDKLRPNAWPYRDYVIRSLNDDTPYWRFVTEQLAGDVLWPFTRDGITATGFIAAGPWDFIGHAEVPETKIDGRIARHLDRDDMVASTMNTFASTTVQCARCHDHKFDPVTQEHYYSLQAVFAALDRADRPYDLDPEVAKRRAALTGRQAELVAEQQAVEAAIEDAAGDRLQQLEAKLQELQREAATDKDAAASEIQKVKQQRAALLESVTSTPAREQLVKNAAARKQVDDALKKLPPINMVYAGTIHSGSGAFRGTGADGGRPRTIHVLHRGNIQQPREQVGPGTIPIIPGADWRFELPVSHAESDRRVALAKWLVRRDNPLTWRSIVNRVWQYHFGRGIVDSPNDFGRMGKQPSHPDLLDWLAVEFRDGGQSLKSLHRLIVTSSVYRQSSQFQANNAAIDSGNVYLWRMNRRRLDAEQLRDALLAVSGRLNRNMFGPGMQLFVLERPEHSPHYEYHKHDPDDPRSLRRTVYRFVVRSQPDPFMTTLDCADSSQSVPKRDETVTALQALSLLNNKFVLRMAEHFAQRVRREATGVDRQVATAYRLATGHEPDPQQHADLLTFTEDSGLENTCRLLFNLNEFVFVD